MRSLLPTSMRAVFSIPVRRAVLAAAVLGGSPGLAISTTSNSGFSVSVTVIDRCVISSRDMPFARAATANAAAPTARGAITARCAKGAAVAIALDQGVNAAPGSTAAMPVRRMTDGTHLYLPYRIELQPATGGQDGIGPKDNAIVAAVLTASSAPLARTGAGLRSGAPMPDRSPLTGTPTPGLSQLTATPPPDHYVDVVTATIIF